MSNGTIGIDGDELFLAGDSGPWVLLIRTPLPLKLLKLEKKLFRFLCGYFEDYLSGSNKQYSRVCISGGETFVE